MDSNENPSFNLTLALNAYCEAFAHLQLSTLHSTLMPLLSDDVRFKDPFNDVTGKPNVSAIFEHMFATLQHPAFTIEHTALAGHVGYIHWQFHFATQGKEYGIQGLSQVTFNAQGFMSQHLDFWDPAEHVYTHVPVLGWALKKIASKLAAPLP